MSSTTGRVILISVVLLALLSGTTSSFVRAAGEDTHLADFDGPPTAVEQSDGDINESLRQLGESMRESPYASTLEGQQINVQIQQSGSATVRKGIEVESGRDVRIEPGGFTDPAFSTTMSSVTLDSITTSPDRGRALQKAIKYDMVSVSAAAATTQVATILAIQGSHLRNRPRISSARLDFDGDQQPEGLLEIEALDSNDDQQFDHQVRTVLRDVDNDGDMDTVSSERQPIAASVMGTVDLDLNEDNQRDTQLRLTGVDTDTDTLLDRRVKETLLDTRDDTQFDSYSETLEPISPSTTVTGEWDLNEDGEVSARLRIQGEDTDGDGDFDRRHLTVSLNLDDQPGFESTSTTTTRVHPQMRISAEFDHDSDGSPDTRASLSASDTNGDGSLDSKSVSVVDDTDDDGAYDRVVRRDESTRGFISNSGTPIQYLDNPKNLTIIGVVVSILSMLLQLVRGG